jgi:glycosyltransferase involved in cell wall biosynthesis
MDAGQLAAAPADVFVPAESPTDPPLRIIVASHSHPEVSKGGAEIAAFQLFRSLQARDDCEAWFIGCDRDAATDRPGAVLSQPFSDREYLYASTSFDWFKLANGNSRFPAEIERLLTKLSPQIVHFHHYINFGVEVFQHLKRAVPDCKILLTLHEYLAICHHFGQMVTKRHRNLCYQSSPSRCQQCFPEFDKSDFFLRKRYIERFFDLVDGFISPSRFLAERYIAWGLPAEKMTVLENVVSPAHAGREGKHFWPDPPLRLGFFGQISVLKGIEVVLDAAQLLDKQGGPDVTFDIFGEYRGQPPEFVEAFLARLGKVGNNVYFHGPYDQSRVDQLMQSVHAVLIPSIWWENSPVVIQEALRNRRPVICSDIGGMAEKVRDGIDGFHFPAGSVAGLAALARRLAAQPEILASLSEKISPQATPDVTIAAHFDLYRRHLKRG